MFAATRAALRRCAVSALAPAGGASVVASAARQLSVAAAARPGALAGSCTRSAVAAVAAGSAQRLTACGFHASAAGAAASEDDEDGIAEEKTLFQVLTEELEHEKEEYKPNETIAKGPPAPWAASDEEGDCEITLKREFGTQTIAVVYDVSESPYVGDDTEEEEEEEEGEEEGEEVQIEFCVTVTQAEGESLVFTCATDGETVEVSNVQHVNGDDNEDGEETSTIPYSGPNYDELDDSVQEEFHKYLEVRGIDGDLANFIMMSHLDKEQKEYMRWLRSVSNFVSEEKQ